MAPVPILLFLSQAFPVAVAVRVVDEGAVVGTEEIPSLAAAVESVKSWWASIPECSAAAAKLSPGTALHEVGAYMNPLTWVMSFRNVMEIDADLDDLEELDTLPERAPFLPGVREGLQAEELLENLASLESAVVAEMWVQWSREAGFTHLEFIKWLQSVGEGREIAGFQDLLQALLDMGIWAPAERRLLVAAQADSGEKASEAPTEPKQEQTMSDVEPVFKGPSGGVVGVRAKTSMFEDAYWRNKLLKAIWPHKDHIGGYMIRTALGKVGKDAASASVHGQDLAQNKKLMSQNTAFNAYSDKTVVAWEEVDDLLMSKLWQEVSAMFRELEGVSPDEEYIVAFTFRGMKAGGLLDRSGKGLPGAIWHKDVFADHVAIIYPFCFLPGYNNEITSTTEYEKADPGSKHLAKFTGDVADSQFVETVPPGATAGFGESVGFNNMLTRHRAWPPTNASRDEIHAARHQAHAWGVPDNAVRAMLHITIRKKSWTDLAEQLAFTLPDVVGTLIGPAVKCLQQVPAIEQWWFNTYGGFIDRNDRRMLLF